MSTKQSRSTSHTSIPSKTISTTGQQLSSSLESVSPTAADVPLTGGGSGSYAAAVPLTGGGDKVTAQQPLHDYSDKAKEFFTKNNNKGAVRLANGGVRVGPISVRQARKASATDAQVVSDNFNFWLPVPSPANLDQLPVMHRAHYTDQVEPVGTSGYFGNYESAGFFAPDKCTKTNGNAMTEVECAKPEANEVLADPSDYLPYFQPETAALCEQNSTEDGVDMIKNVTCELWMNETRTLAVVIDFLLINPYAEETDGMVSTCTVTMERPGPGGTYVQAQCSNTGDIPYKFDLVVIFLIVVYALFEVCNVAQQKCSYLSSPWKW